MEDEEKGQQRVLDGVKKLGKKSAKIIGALLKKIILNPKVALILLIFSLIFIGVLFLVGIFGDMASGNLAGSDDKEVNEKLKQEYVEATEEVFPGVKTETAEELNYQLDWEMVYAIDMYSAESKGNHDLPYNDLDELAEELKPRFEYETSTITITTEKEVEVEKETEDGEIEKETEIKTETEEKEVSLLKHVDTIKGDYDYSYETEERTSKSDDGKTKVTVEKKVISDIDFEQDYSRLDNVIKDKLDLDEVREVDRDLVLQTTEAIKSGESSLELLIGQPSIGENSFGSIDISSLPDEWIEAFEDAGDEYKVEPEILMAIAYVESSFRPDAVGPPNPSGELARGMMQFLPSTFEEFGVDGSETGEKDMFDPIDAIYSAANYLNHLGIDENSEKALYQYSGGSNEYVEKVLRLSQTIGTDSGDGVFAWPAPASREITSPYGVRVDPVDGTKTHHNGIDIGAECGTPIVASADGKVSEAGSAQGYGQWIVINHSDGLTTIYGHMYEDDLFVKAGDDVKRGEEIAKVGSNGKSTGCHLHFEVDRNGETVDPMTLLNAF